MLLAITAMLHLSGCSGTVFADANNVAETILASLTALLTALAVIPGTEKYTAAIQEIATVTQNILKLMGEYRQNQNESTLQQIEDGIQLAITNLQQIFGGTGLSQSVIAKVEAIAQLILTEFEAWSNQVNALKPAPAQAQVVPGHALAAFNAQVATQHSYAGVKPLSNHDLKQKINAVLESKTGDAQTDEAFEKAGKI
jgi:hypothetical protein